MRKKLVVSAITIILLLSAGVAGVVYRRGHVRGDCISYYGKDGKQLLYQDCK